jgi:hypothetical protein
VDSNGIAKASDGKFLANMYLPMGAKFSTSCNLFRKPCSSFTHWSLKNTRRYDEKNLTKYGTVMSWDLGIEAVFWIRNELVRIRILLYKSFRIRILLFKPDQPYNWKILSEPNETDATCKIFLRKYLPTVRYVIKDQPGHFAEIFANYTDFLVKEVRPGSDMAKKFQIRPDPQHCSKVPHTYFSE